MLAVMAFAAVCAMAQSRPDSYNYKRGLEAVENQKLDEAIEYFNKDLEENPKNGYSYSWIAYLRYCCKEYGKAMTAANMAIKNLPKKDKEYVVFAYDTRGDIYLELADTVKALESYTQAIKADPERSAPYEKRARLYHFQHKYDLAEPDYRKSAELSPGNMSGYIGLGQMASVRKNWDEALKQYSYAIRLDDTKSYGYSLRASIYIEMKKWDEATDDIMSSLAIDWDDIMPGLLLDLPNSARTMLIAKMRVRAAKSPNEPIWPYVIGSIYEDSNEYEKAIKAYSEANAIQPSAVTYSRMAICCQHIGDYEEALVNISKGQDLDSTYFAFKECRASVYYDMDKPELSIKELDGMLAQKPDYAVGYRQRGWYKSLMRDKDGAVEDYTMAIVLFPEYASALVGRGQIYAEQGKKELAEADFKKVVEIENTPEKYSCVHYALQGLGQNDKAIAAMDTIIARDTTDCGTIYDAACLYSRMHDKQKALQYLEKSLRLGYKEFSHISHDYDMDFLRGTEEFKALIRKYQGQAKKAAGAAGNGAAERKPLQTVTTEVPFVREDGICKVKCSINGLPLHFYFDTGASDVTLSMVEATFMMKNGYLSDKDVVGSQRYVDANGEVSVGTVVNLKSVAFGDLKLKNIRASVVRNQKAPLLLGQSVLGRLGKIEIDNSSRMLRITQRK